MATVKPGTYTLGPSDGTVIVKTGRDGMAARVGHDLTLEVARWSATVTVPNGTGDRPSARASLDAASFEVREGSGGAMPLSGKDINEIKKNTAEKVLQTDKHPEITFEARNIAEAPGGLTVDGEVTLLGQRRPVTFRLDMQEEGGATRIKGIIPLKQTELGIKPYKALMGALKVKDEVQITVDLRLPAS